MEMMLVKPELTSCRIEIVKVVQVHAVLPREKQLDILLTSMSSQEHHLDGWASDEALLRYPGRVSAIDAHWLVTQERELLCHEFRNCLFRLSWIWVYTTSDRSQVNKFSSLSQRCSKIRCSFYMPLGFDF
jgi:hypothetical protein